MRNDDRCTDSSGIRPSTLQLDPEKYQSELDAFDLTAEQQQELLTTLWSITRSFVELGFNVDVCAALFDDNSRVHLNDELN